MHALIIGKVFKICFSCFVLIISLKTSVSNSWFLKVTSVLSIKASHSSLFASLKIFNTSLFGILFKNNISFVFWFLINAPLEEITKSLSDNWLEMFFTNLKLLPEVKTNSTFLSFSFLTVCFVCFVIFKFDVKSVPSRSQKTMPLIISFVLLSFY